MNEVELIYHYSQSDYANWVYERNIAITQGLSEEEDLHFKDILDCLELEIKLNGVTVMQGDQYHNKIFDFKKGFMLACTKLLTFYSTKKTYIADLEY